MKCVTCNNLFDSINLGIRKKMFNEDCAENKSTLKTLVNFVDINKSNIWETRKMCVKNY